MLHPRNLDTPLAAWVAKLPSQFAPVMTAASFIASPLPIATILGLVLISALFTDNALLLKSTLIVILLSPIAELSKFITRRKRPETLYVENMRFKTYSFPSGHSYISALVFGFLAVTVAGSQPVGGLIATLFGVIIILVGISRIYLGAHFPSDVLAGWSLGLLALLLIIGLRQ